MAANALEYLISRSQPGPDKITRPPTRWGCSARFLWVRGVRRLGFRLRITSSANIGPPIAQIRHVTERSKHSIRHLGGLTSNLAGQTWSMYRWLESSVDGLLVNILSPPPVDVSEPGQRG